METFFILGNTAPTFFRYCNHSVCSRLSPTPKDFWSLCEFATSTPSSDYCLPPSGGRTLQLPSYNMIHETSDQDLPLSCSSSLVHLLAPGRFVPSPPSMKVAFFVAITVARRVSELGAIVVDPPYMVFHKENVSLQLCSKFLPKIVSEFHITQMMH